MFVGREDSLRLVRGAITARRPVVLVGEAGIGKTTLVREALAASEPGGRAARSRRTSPRVFNGGALGMLAWRDYLALERALGRPVNGVDAAAVAVDVQDAVRDGVLVVEDLQWAAAPTIEVLASLAGRIAIVGTVRSNDLAAPATLEALGAAGFDELAVEPLDATEAVRLLRINRPGLGESTMSSLVRRSGGSPLLLTELAADGTASSGLRRSLSTRLRELDSAAREVFLLLALAGSPLREEVLSPGGVKALRAVSLLTEVDRGRLAPRHALLGELAVVELTDAERIALHASLAGLVDGPGEAARHHAAAGDRTLAHASALAAAAQASTPGERAEHLQLAASVVDGPDADGLRLSAARALAEGYDWHGVERVLGDLTPDADAETRAVAWLLRARGAWGTGRSRLMVPALQAGLDACEGRDSDTELLLRIESSRVPIFLELTPSEALPRTAVLVELAEQRGVGLARAKYFHGTALAMTGHPEGLVVLAEAVEDAFHSGDFDTEFTAANNLISFHESDGDPDVGRAFAVRMRDRATELGLGMWATSMRYQIAQLDFHAGRCRALLTETEDLLRLPLDLRSRDAAREVHCMALIDLGRIEEADRLAAQWMAEAADDQQGATQFLWVKAESALCGGRPAEALSAIDEFLASSGGEDPNLIFGWTTRAWARYGIGRDPGPPPEDPGRLMLAGVVPEVAGVDLLARGHHVEAAEQFATAAAAWERYHRRGWLRCTWAQGEALRLGGLTDSAVQVLRLVERAATELGFVSHAAWARHSLREAGERSGAPRGAAVGGLTRREAEVLTLVGQGLTNGQIAERLGISHSTVVTQIGSAAERLGAVGRTQAAGLYRALADERPSAGPHR